MGIWTTLLIRFRRNQQGGIDSYVTTAVMILLAILGAGVLLGLNDSLMTWLSGMVSWLTRKQPPTS